MGMVGISNDTGYFIRRFHVIVEVEDLPNGILVREIFVGLAFADDDAAGFAEGMSAIAIDHGEAEHVEDTLGFW
jgi:hypothetical protein